MAKRFPKRPPSPAMLCLASEFQCRDLSQDHKSNQVPSFTITAEREGCL